MTIGALIYLLYGLFSKPGGGKPDNTITGFRGKRFFDFQKTDADIRQDALGPNIILSIDF